MAKDYYESSDDEIKEEQTNLTIETFSKVLWILVPMVIGGLISMFSNVERDLQVLIWGILFIIIGFGLWRHNDRIIRIKREKTDKMRWRQLNGNLDEKFDKMDERFDEIDSRFDLSENTDKTLLRSQLINAHREWVEGKGYITTEALEYCEKIHDAYASIGGNDIGDKLWEDIRRLPIDERRQKSSD